MDTTVTIATLLESVGTVFTTSIGWVGAVADEIVAHPLLMLGCVGVPLCGIAVGMIKRLLHVRM